MLVAAGNVGTDLRGTVLLDDVKTAVPSIWRAAGGSPWTLASVQGGPTPSSLRAIISTRTIGTPNRLVAVGQMLGPEPSSYVAVSDDCGSTWRTQVLSGGLSSTFAEAVTADDRGIVIVGRTHGPEPLVQSVIIWTSNDAASFAASIIDTETSLQGRIELVIRSEATVTIGLTDNDRRGAQLLRWDGTGSGRFSRIGKSVTDLRPIGMVATPDGVRLLSFGKGGRPVEFRRFAADGLGPDVLPQINGQRYRQMRLLGDGGYVTWLIGERDDFVMDAWSITPLATTSDPER